MTQRILFAVALLIGLAPFTEIHAQKKAAPSATPTERFDQSLYSGLRWRELGPFRGGRSTTVTGIRGNNNLYYFGAVGGGVWKTEDAGQTWSNISDKYFGGTVTMVPRAVRTNFAVRLIMPCRLPWAWALIRPVPVILKRFLALLLVFSLGILLSSFLRTAVLVDKPHVLF